VTTSPVIPARQGRPWRRLCDQVKAEESHCWLCKEPLRPHLRWPHRWSTTIDHVIPLSKGGPLLERWNVHAAHLTCNASRGDGTRERQAEPTSRQW
jgi:5-methylcytosine-specific restriction endonuclease McrA